MLGLIEWQKTNLWTIPLICSVCLTFWQTTDLLTLHTAEALLNYLAAGLIALLFVRGKRQVTRSDHVFTIIWVVYVMVLHEFVTYVPVFSEQVIHGSFEVKHTLYNLNLHPFATIQLTFNRQVWLPLMVKQIVGNVLLFIPFSYLILRLGIVRKAWQAFLVSILVTCLIETLQFILSYIRVVDRSTDIDDVLLNTLGAVIGILVYFIFHYKSRISKNFN
ncbi:VanZ family protein [Halobacillus rhizosphaerae]|uniref:VanZ family protein n=1 Tax=Halobacillus rhizosphaerae TaxID=3064889 RepID=UPI00398AFAA0